MFNLNFILNKTKYLNLNTFSGFLMLKSAIEVCDTPQAAFGASETQFAVFSINLMVVGTVLIPEHSSWRATAHQLRNGPHE